MNSLNLQEIDTETALSLARFYIRSQQNLALFGQTGIGKTHLGMTAAKELKMGINYLNLSVLYRNDLLGYPMLFEPGEVVSFKSPYYLPKLKDGEKSTQILLLDELDKADPEIFAPLLEILQFRTLNGAKINCSSIILTGNLPEENVGSNSIPITILNRCAAYQLIFNLDKWLSWGRTNNVHPLILSFIQSNPEYACGTINTGTTLASSTPRSWTSASEAIFAAKVLKITDEASITSIVSGFVGFSAGLQFSTWYRFYRKFETFIASLLETGSCQIEYEKLTLTEQMIFVVSACHLCRLKFVKESQKKVNYKSVERLCSFLIKNNVSLENMAIGLSNAFPMDLVADPKFKLYNCQPFFELTSKISIPKK